VGWLAWVKGASQRVILALSHCFHGVAAKSFRDLAFLESGRADGLLRRERQDLRVVPLAERVCGFLQLGADEVELAYVHPQFVYVTLAPHERLQSSVLFDEYPSFAFRFRWHADTDYSGKREHTFGRAC
jgi:hypothetical protein